MSYNNLLFTKKDGIGIVTINRPDVLNALNVDVFADLCDVFHEIDNDPEVRVVILTGAGEKAFVAGADIADMQPRSSIEVVDFQVLGRKAISFITWVSQSLLL